MPRVSSAISGYEIGSRTVEKTVLRSDFAGDVFSLKQVIGGGKKITSAQGSVCEAFH